MLVFVYVVVMVADEKGAVGLAAEVKSRFFGVPLAVIFQEPSNLHQGVPSPLYHTTEALQECRKAAVPRYQLI